jgi:hypothetical protein
MPAGMPVDALILSIRMPPPLRCRLLPVHVPHDVSDAPPAVNAAGVYLSHSVKAEPVNNEGTRIRTWIRPNLREKPPPSELLNITIIFPITNIFKGRDFGIYDPSGDIF